MVVVPTNIAATLLWMSSVLVVFTIPMIYLILLLHYVETNE